MRELTAADLDAAMDLHAEVAREGRWIATEYPFDRAERRDRFRGFIDDPDQASFVVDADGAIVGHGGAGRRSSAVPVSVGMMVRAGWRGRGVGSALLAACIDWARSAGAHKVTLEVWPHNEAALALYRKFGFQQEGYFVKHYRRRSGELWDSIAMGLLL